MNRRQFVAISGILGTTGCLRLSGEDPTTGSDTPSSTDETKATTTDRTATETQTRTATETVGPVTGLAHDWEYEAERNADLSVAADAALVHTAGGVAHVEGAIAIDVDAGERRWHALTERAVITGTPRHGGGAVVGAEDGTVAAIDATGDVRWTTTFEDPPVGRPAVTDDVVIVGTGRNDDVRPSVGCLNASSGDVRWQIRDEHATATYDDAVTVRVHDDVVYVGYTNAVAAYALDDGERIWTSHANVPPLKPGALTVDDDRVYVPRSPGLAAYDAATGEEVWFFEPYDDFKTRLCWTHDVLYAGSDDASIYAIQTETGEARWRTQVTAPLRQLARYRETLFGATAGGDLVAVGVADGNQRFVLERERTDSLAASTNVLLATDGASVDGYAPVHD